MYIFFMVTYKAQEVKFQCAFMGLLGYRATCTICTTLQGRRHAISCFEGECAFDDGVDK